MAKKASRTAWDGRMYVFAELARLAQLKAATRDTFENQYRADYLLAHPQATQGEVDAYIATRQTDLDNEASYWDNSPRWTRGATGVVVLGGEFQVLPGMRQIWRNIFQRGDLDGDGTTESRKGRYMLVDEETRELIQTNFRANTGATVGVVYTFQDAVTMLNLVPVPLDPDGL